MAIKIGQSADGWDSRPNQGGGAKKGGRAAVQP